MIRKINKIIPGASTVDGAGVHLQRVFGSRQVPMFDPYLMLDFFNSQNPEEYIKGFPWHPHRGIETVTFLFSGKIEHGDSLGNQGVIEGGDCQWMTAGSGIIHQEMPMESDLMLGIQLWANLPASDKMTVPRYMEIKSDDIPSFEENSISFRIIAGNYNGHQGPVQRKDIDAMFMDIVMPGNTALNVDTRKGHTVFALLVSGSAVFAVNSPPVEEPGSAVLFEDGNAVNITAGKTGARFLFISGKPIGEPVAWGGPIVMNTQEELETAFREYSNGTFVKNQAMYDRKP